MNKEAPTLNGDRPELIENRQFSYEELLAQLRTKGECICETTAYLKFTFKALTFTLNNGSSPSLTVTNGASHQFLSCSYNPSENSWHEWTEVNDKGDYGYQLVVFNSLEAIWSYAVNMQAAREAAWQDAIKDLSEGFREKLSGLS
jgi:hypothetical protein